MSDSTLASFLSELSVLLDVDAESPRAEPAAGPYDELLCASDQLVEETQALLSSCSSETADASSQPKRIRAVRSTAKAKSQSMDERRKARNANAAKRRLKYTKRVKDEREQLKQQDEQLSAQLADLQAKQTANKWVLERTRAMPVWRAIAARQLQGRLLAEAERRRLRGLVAARGKLLHELGEKMRLHLQESGITMDGSEDRSAPLLESGDSLLFDRFLMEAEAAFDEIDEVLCAWRVRDGPLSSSRARSKCGEQEIFETLDVQLAPFDFRQTGDALWEAMRHVHHQNGHQRYRSVADLGDVIAVKFQVQDASCLTIRIVMKRRIESGRTAILWRAHTQGDGELSSIHADETGWSVVCPTDAGTKSAVGMPTEILTFIRFIPGNNGSDAERNETRFGRFMQLAESSGHEYGAEVVRMMESLLLDESRGAAQCPGQRLALDIYPEEDHAQVTVPNSTEEIQNSEPRDKVFPSSLSTRS